MRFPSKLRVLCLIPLVATLAVGCGSSSTSPTDPDVNSSSDNNDSGTGNPDNESTDNTGANNEDNNTDSNGANNDDTTTGNNTGDNSGDTTGTSTLSRSVTPVSQLAVDITSTNRFSVDGQQKAANLTQPTGVVFSVVDNHGGDVFNGNNGDTCATLGAQFNSCSAVNLHIKDTSGTLDQGDWKLYFHSIRRILRVDSTEFSVSHVNGDLNVLEPTSEFTGFSQSSVKNIGLVTEFNHLIESDFMPRYWIVRGNGEVVLLPNTDDDTNELQYALAIAGDNQLQFNGEQAPLATAASRFSKNQAVQDLVDNSPLSPADLQRRIIPAPRSIVNGIEGAVTDISGGFSFAGTEINAGSVAALEARQRLIMPLGTGTPLTASIDTSLGANTYRLNVASNAITLTGSDQEALFNGAQSLLGAVQIGVGSIPTFTIEDSPRFTYRGMHLDVARNFQSVASVKLLLDQMAAYKLNTLHFHLSDDEGWRLEIPSLPELTSVGAVRKFQLDSEGQITEIAGLMPQLGSGPESDNQGSGFFTRAEFIDLLQYAADRHISVIPEFDMPAHARAAVIAMRARAVNLGDPLDTNVRIDDPDDTSRYLTIQHYDDGIINPCIPGTYNLISSVVNDVQAMYSQAGQSLDVWHMGGDEANNVFKGSGFQAENIDVNAWEFPWEASPACASFIANTPEVSSRDDLQIYFVGQVAQILADAGIPAMYAYQDIYDTIAASSLATTRAGVAFWEPISSGNGVNNANDLTNRGFETVVAVPDFLYFDFAQEVDPSERGFYWATRFTDARKVFSFAPENLPQNAETSVNREGRAWSATGSGDYQGFIGMQGHLWGETVRTAEQMEYMLFPRLFALAERAWAKGAWELDYQAGVTFSGSTNLVNKDVLNQDFATFAQALALKELPKLDAANIRYRIPVPGASNESGALVMNSSLPGLPLQFSTDGNTFSNFTAGNPAGAVTAIRATTPNASRVGRADSFPQ